MCLICELKETLWNGLLDFLPSYLDLWGTRRNPKHFPGILGRYPVVGTLVLKRELSGLLPQTWLGWRVSLHHSGVLWAHFTWAGLFPFFGNIVSEYPFTSQILCFSAQSWELSVHPKTLFDFLWSVLFSRMIWAKLRSLAGWRLIGYNKLIINRHL